MKLVIKKRKDFPKCIRHFKELKGICVGNCVSKSYNMHDKDKDEAAHAHYKWSHSYPGWICLRYKYQLKERLTLLHEVAHLIANTTRSVPHHGKKWKAVVKAIGGTLKPYWSADGYKYLDYTKRGKYGWGA